MAIPVLETPRLILRAHTLDDFPAYAAMWCDAETVKFITGVPDTEEGAWARFLRAAGQWAMLGYGFWCIEEKHSGKRVGECGFINAKREINPSLEGMPEVGWALAPFAQRKGYASEAVAAALAWGEGNIGRIRMCCIISPENMPSIRVAEKFRFRQVAETNYKGTPTLVFFRDP